MKGDFSRFTFDPSRHYSRVLMQQGRVQLDADWNEQADIHLHRARLLTADLIGPYGGPINRLGFGITPAGAGDFGIGAGRYYVDGILCENEAEKLTYRTQPHFPLPENHALQEGRHLAYLHVWERHITALQDESIREVALGGPDTATRAKVVWQVKIHSLDDGSVHNLKAFHREWSRFVERTWRPKKRGRMKARTESPAREDGGAAANASAGFSYRGAENRLYRVEIHRSGAAWDPDRDRQVAAATFKWSRDNGSVVYPVVSFEDHLVWLGSLDGGGGRALRPGDLVEVLDDGVVLHGAAGPLVEVLEVDPQEGIVKLDMRGERWPFEARGAKHPLLRLWDHGGGGSEGIGGGPARRADDHGLSLQEGEWIHLEDGVQISFEPRAGEGPGTRYRSGDYWLIPARTATADVEWPLEETGGNQAMPRALPPYGIAHHYAPLALLTVRGSETQIHDLRCQFRELREARVKRAGLLTGLLRWALEALGG